MEEFKCRCGSEEFYVGINAIIIMCCDCHMTYGNFDGKICDAELFEEITDCVYEWDFTIVN